MKRKTLALLMSVLLLTGLLAACGNGSSGSSKASQASASTADTAAGAGEKKVLRVGMECAYAPFNWTQENETVSNGDKAVPIYGTSFYAYGYDVMVAKKLADQLGWDLEIHKVEWDSIGLAMDSGEYDCIIAGMGKTAEREKAYSFTEPYYYRDISITVKKDGPFAGFTKLSEFAGKNATVTTQLGTAWVSLLEQIPDAQPVANYATTAECFMAVSNGVADLTVIDLPTSQSAVMTNDDLVTLSLDADDTIIDASGSINVCIATRLDDTALRDTIQGAMDALNWNDKAAMDELMAEAITLQPAAS